MVFYDRHKTKALRHKTSILDLPEELIGDIIALDHLTRSDILSARLAHPYLTPTCSEVIRKELKRLYIHPSPRALTAALSICAHDIFNRDIEELVVLGQIDWLEIGKLYSPNARNPDSRWDAWDGPRKFCAWPAILPEMPRSRISTRGEVDSLQSAVNRIVPSASNTFEVAYGPFLEAVGNLPKLQKLSFAEEVTLPGFNQVSRSTIASAAKKAILPTSQSSKLTAPALKPTTMSAKLRRPWADAHILMGVLAQKDLCVRRLC